MISYKPLKLTLVHKGKTLADLDAFKGGPLNTRTVSKLRHNKSMNLDSIVKICKFLDCRIEDVVEVILDDSEGSED